MPDWLATVWPDTDGAAGGLTSLFESSESGFDMMLLFLSTLYISMIAQRQRLHGLNDL
jgi:hypothetical protein